MFTQNLLNTIIYYAKQNTNFNVTKPNQDHSNIEVTRKN